MNKYWGGKWGIKCRTTKEIGFDSPSDSGGGARFNKTGSRFPL